MSEYDYIIVGAGSAGCVLAERLSRSGRSRILVLEAGGTDRRLSIRAPIGYGLTFHNPAVNWRFASEPEAALEGRAIYTPRGKVLGGSSSINAMVYSRGIPSDYEAWEGAGNPGWGAAETAAAYDRLERETGLSVADRSDETHPVGGHYLTAVKESGLDRGDPSREEGAGAYRTTTRGRWRCSAADAFLRPAMARLNVHVLTGAEVERVLIENGRAVGVRYRRRGAQHQARCRGEVLLAAGAVKSPQILQLSGFGPGETLRAHGIETLVANDGVGGALQDHLGIDYHFRATKPTLNQDLGGWAGRIRAGLRFVLFGDGPLSMSVNQFGGMVRSQPGAEVDVQLYFNPLTYSTTYRNRRPLLRPDPWPGFIIGFNPTRPTSRGRIDIASPDPFAAPRIAPNYLSTNEDIEAVVASARLTERLIATPAMQALIEAPGGFTPTGRSDEELIADFRARASTVFHLCGTCRMAPRAAGGVVDPDLKVYGVEGLRVVDASVFPNVTSANTNAPAMLVGMMGADRILAA